MLCGSIVPYDIRYVSALVPVSIRRRRSGNMENHAKHIRLFDVEIHFRYDKCVRELNTWLQANKYISIYVCTFAIADFYIHTLLLSA